MIQPDAQNPQYIDVVINGILNPLYRYPAQLLSGISVSDLGPGSTLKIDTGLALLNTITFNGGGNANLAFQPNPNPTATTQSNTVVGATRTIVINGPNGFLTVVYTNGAGPPQNLPPDPPINWIGQGLRNLLSSPLGLALDAQDVPLLGTTLGDVIDGVETSSAVTDPDAGGDPDAGSVAGGGSSGPGLFEMLFEEGTGAFDLNAIGGPTIPDLATLDQDLLGLSDPAYPGSVQVTQPNGGVQFDVTINKTLDGSANLDLEALGGTVTLTGSVNVSVLVHIHLIFGVDSEGFYIDTDLGETSQGQPLPMLTVDHIAISPDPDLTVSGDFGIFDITASSLTITVDQAIGASLSLPLESLDTITGATDSLLRPEDFGTMADIATTQLLWTAGQSVQVNATINVDSGLFGSIIPSALQNLQLAFLFDDPSDPTDVTISGPGFSSIGDLIKKSETDILQVLQQLATLGNQIDASALMSTTLPGIDRSLGSYVQLGAVFNQGLYQPVSAYFASLGTNLPTVSGLLGAIFGASGTNGDLSLSLAPGLDLSVQSGALLLSYAFTATRTDPIALDLGLGSNSPISLDANLAVELQTQFSFDASIGVNLLTLLQGAAPAMPSSSSSTRRRRSPRACSAPEAG